MLTDAVSRIMSIFQLGDPAQDEAAAHRRLLLATMSARAIMSGVLTAITHHIDPAVAVRTCATFIIAGISAAYPAALTTDSSSSLTLRSSFNDAAKGCRHGNRSTFGRARAPGRSGDNSNRPTGHR
ncbi:Uncharacterised protein [Mycobacteroides abscessus subsp. massiliense]|nr:Uncharacterised protein [Mycobacteroides abscessus subsp. massiliense]